MASNNLILGERCAIGANSRIETHGVIQIGNDFLAASGLTLVSGSHDVLSLKPFAEKILIGDRVWCGVNVTILSNVSIGDDVVIGAGSIVTKDIPSNSIAVGAPAKVIKALKRDSSINVWSVFD